MAKKREELTSQERKERPIFSGVLRYFPDALLEVAELSRIANEKHNPGQPLHWSKDKSNDHGDALVRHQLDAGKWDELEGYRVRHSAEVAWRALAQLQTEIENERQDGQLATGLVGSPIGDAQPAEPANVQTIIEAMDNMPRPLSEEEIVQIVGKAVGQSMFRIEAAIEHARPLPPMAYDRSPKMK